MDVPLYLQEAFPDCTIQLSNPANTRRKLTIITPEGIEAICMMGREIVEDAKINKVLESFVINRMCQAIERVRNA